MKLSLVDGAHPNTPCLKLTMRCLAASSDGRNAQSTFRTQASFPLGAPRNSTRAALYVLLKFDQSTLEVFGRLVLPVRLLARVQLV